MPPSPGGAPRRVDAGRFIFARDGHLLRKVMESNVKSRLLVPKRILKGLLSLYSQRSVSVFRNCTISSISPSSKLDLSFGLTGNGAPVSRLLRYRPRKSVRSGPQSPRSNHDAFAFAGISGFRGTPIAISPKSVNCGEVPEAP